MTTSDKKYQTKKGGKNGSERCGSGLEKSKKRKNKTGYEYFLKLVKDYLQWLFFYDVF